MENKASESREQGREEMLRSLIRKKLEKGKSPEEISDELEISQDEAMQTYIRRKLHNKLRNA